MQDIKRQRLAGSSHMYDRLHESHTVSFASAFPSRHLKLIEVSEKLLDSINKGDSLSIVGENSSEAVLCSGSQTFSIKRVETSNAVFFIPPTNDTNYRIESVCSDYYELRTIPGKIELIKSHLLSSTYPSELSGEDEDGIHFLSRKQLGGEIQASCAEIDNALTEMNVVEVNGKLRILSSKALQDAIRSLLETIIALDWKIAAQPVTWKQCADAMPECDPIVLRYVLLRNSTFANTRNGTNNGGDGGDDPIFHLCPKKLRLASAHLLFQEKPGQQIPVDEFYADFSLRTPGLDYIAEVATTQSATVDTSCGVSNGQIPITATFGIDDLLLLVEGIAKKVPVASTSANCDSDSGNFAFEYKAAAY